MSEEEEEDVVDDVLEILDRLRERDMLLLNRVRDLEERVKELEKSE